LEVEHELGELLRAQTNQAGVERQDVYSGLQTVDQTSGLVAAELEATPLTGMAATAAANGPSAPTGIVSTKRAIFAATRDQSRADCSTTCSAPTAPSIWSKSI
jgi:hypothetical protein